MRINAFCPLHAATPWLIKAVDLDGNGARDLVILDSSPDHPIHVRFATAEKRPISKQATVGLYYFRRARDLFEGAEKMIVKGLSTSGQFFVCPVFNELILAGKNITTSHVPEGAMHSLGTPEDVELFLKQFRAIAPGAARA